MNVGNSPFYPVKMWIFPEFKLNKNSIQTLEKIPKLLPQLWKFWFLCHFPSLFPKCVKHTHATYRPFFQFGFWKYSHFDSIERGISNIHFQSPLVMNFFRYWKWILPPIERSLRTKILKVWKSLKIFLDLDLELHRMGNFQHWFSKSTCNELF